jgi:hypothetical protein
MYVSADEIDVSLVVSPLACHLPIYSTMRGRWDTTGLAASSRKARADSFCSLSLSLSQVSCAADEISRSQLQGETEEGETAHLNLKNQCIEAIISHLCVCGGFLCSNLPGRNQQWKMQVLHSFKYVEGGEDRRRSELGKTNQLNI